MTNGTNGTSEQHSNKSIHIAGYQLPCGDLMLKSDIGLIRSDTTMEVRQ